MAGQGQAWRNGPRCGPGASGGLGHRAGSGRGQRWPLPTAEPPANRKQYSDRGGPPPFSEKPAGPRDANGRGRGWGRGWGRGKGKEGGEEAGQPQHTSCYSGDCSVTISPGSFSIHVDGSKRKSSGHNGRRTCEQPAESNRQWLPPQPCVGAFTRKAGAWEWGGAGAWAGKRKRGAGGTGSEGDGSTGRVLMDGSPQPLEGKK
ncbi:serine/threonine-protein phosphatase 1 regulatory subunit 10-like [Perognathus longimembris pacificus]|uniref:serine/threonine-protein phosphatase 1 regulatory subunit 10-like n=1 Tax=Perognathus longimembris pacificus TaxID=214514 RepID=UPI0020193B3A|nr:serine/threonine-protein phosphatase 1 regulatory subunit 10-like [Perognathus longimembris pacificus]